VLRGLTKKKETVAPVCLTSSNRIIKEWTDQTDRQASSGPESDDPRAEPATRM
jgi:hypothetical protein